MVGPEWKTGLAYSDYLQSTHWRELRLRILDRAGWACERCGRAATQVHHRTYERIGAELDADLEALCVPCHQVQHPEKKILSVGSVFRVRRSCEMCPDSDMTAFRDDDSVRYMCNRCGHMTAARPAHKPRRKSGKKQKSAGPAKNPRKRPEPKYQPPKWMRPKRRAETFDEIVARQRKG